MMREHRAIAVGLLSLSALTLLVGCSSDYSESQSALGPAEPVEQDDAPETEDLGAGYGAAPDAWDCYYEASYNDDWHDDVICVRGAESFRPTLLPDQGFVTEADMIAAGEAYEAQLNAAG